MPKPKRIELATETDVLSLLFARADKLRKLDLPAKPPAPPRQDK
jgi:hypothetical protein